MNLKMKGKDKEDVTEWLGCADCQAVHHCFYFKKQTSEQIKNKQRNTNVQIQRNTKEK